MRQADGTAGGFYGLHALNMLNMALELAKHNPTYEDIASKFFEHFIFISDAMSFQDADQEEGVSLWSDKDGFTTMLFSGVPATARSFLSRVWSVSSRSTLP